MSRGHSILNDINQARERLNRRAMHHDGDGEGE